MYTKEMKVIEVIINYLDSRGNLANLISENFEDEDDFLRSKINLFNLISINSIVSLNPNFNEKEIEKIVSGIQIINNPRNLSKRRIYNNIVLALKNRQYSFDFDNNILINNKKIEVVFSPSWLYNLVTMSKENTFLRVLLFNKNWEMDIHDDKSLLNYLYHTKMFLISMLGDQMRLNNDYKHAERNTKGVLVGKSNIKTYEIKEAFLRNVPKSTKADVTKYDFSNYSMFLEKSKQGNFFNKTLKEQKEDIKKWIIEDESVSIETNINLTKLLFLLNDNNSYDDICKKVNINMCWAGLLKIYLYILISMDIDYANLYLSKMRIKNYVNDELVSNYAELKETVKEINSSVYTFEIGEIKNKIAKGVEDCNEYRDSKDEQELIRKYNKVREDIDQYVTREKKLARLCNKRNELQNRIHEEKINQPIDLAFDNDKIMSLINEVILTGRIYVLNNVITLEINNKEMGMNVFKLVIPIEDFLYFVDYSNEELLNNNVLKKVA